MPQKQKQKQPTQAQVSQQAAKLILGTEAASRFNKKPIYFENLAGTESERESSGINLAPRPGSPLGDMTVRNFKKVPEWSDIMGTTHHEDIHTLLNQTNTKNNIQMLRDQYNSLGGVPILDNLIKVLQSFRRGDRAGSPLVELPAYTGAFNPDELPGLTESDRREFLDNYFKTLPKTVIDQFRRIMYSHEASRYNPPVVTQPTPSR